MCFGELCPVYGTLHKNSLPPAPAPAPAGSTLITKGTSSNWILKKSHYTTNHKRTNRLPLSLLMYPSKLLTTIRLLFYAQAHRRLSVVWANEKDWVNEEDWVNEWRRVSEWERVSEWVRKREWVRKSELVRKAEWGRKSEWGSVWRSAPERREKVCIACRRVW